MNAINQGDPKIMELLPEVRSETLRSAEIRAALDGAGSGSHQCSWQIASDARSLGRPLCHNALAVGDARRSELHSSDS